MQALQTLSIQKPETVAQAIALHRAGESRYLAGGTDLVPNLRRNIQKAQTLIDVSGLAELRGIHAGEQSLRIGAGVTLESLCEDATVRARAPLLAKAASLVAGPTHRICATVGGNLMQDTRCYFYNQSDWWRTTNEYCMKCEGDTCRVAPKSERCYACYSGDLAPALLALGAEADIAGPTGARREPIAALFADDGMRHLKLAPGDLLISIDVPLEAGWTADYEKLRIRGAIDFPLAGIAVALKRDGDRIAGLRVACTGLNSYPGLVSGLDALIGQKPDEAFHAALDKAVRKEIQPMASTLVAAGYRRRVAAGLARRLVERLYAAAA
ncbi:MAG: 4-hydroxybenzoyl-CoA reductase subunit beta [Zoogloeaceae bacterium]|jgi:4-hydroxybenzoyl-CoA reductase subunit beta|nr:4-hydroxybenzoyl-CoA reductase subunit beta [Zoogloeaceae bacterium]